MKYCIEGIENNNIVENSAVYFDTYEGIIDYAYDIMFFQFEEFHITYLDYDTWYYSEQLTYIINLLYNLWLNE